jgi:hypothetical protein
MPEIETQVKTLSPQDAEQLLELNTHNRHLRPSHVQWLARQMRSGDWKLNGESIKIGRTPDGTDVLLDGQHRLEACVVAGVPFTTLLVTGLPADTQDTVDRGSARTLADALTLDGYTNATALAALAAAMLYTESHGLPELWQYRTNSLNPMEIRRFIDRTESIRDLVMWGDSLKRKTRGMRLQKPICGTLRYHTDRLDEQASETFWKGLTDGVGLEEGSPILAARNLLVAMSGDALTARERRFVQQCVISQAWDKYRKGKTWRHAARPNIMRSVIPDLV